MAIKPCGHCLQPSCDYCQYCMSLHVRGVQMTSIWNGWINIKFLCFCYVRNVRSRVQSFGCNISWYIVVYYNCDIILKIMRCNNCSSTLLWYCVNIELLPSPKSDFPADGLWHMHVYLLLPHSFIAVCLHKTTLDYLIAISPFTSQWTMMRRAGWLHLKGRGYERFSGLEEESP